MSKRRSCSTIPHPVQNTRWIIEDDRYDNWSPNVLEFYYDGDTPTCYSTYMGVTPLGKDWWGGLLGFCGNGFIQETHINAWCNKLMYLRETQSETRPCQSNDYRWTIMPPHFFNMVVEQKHDAYSYADGSRQKFPAFWNVDTVYMPVSHKDQHWLILQINMLSLKVKVYFPNNCNVMHCGESFCIHKKIHQILLEFESPFLWFLGRISYWQLSGINETDTLECAGDDVWPDNGDHTGRNSGVIICMLMEKLVQNFALTWEEENLQDACVRYRRYMADELYAGRFTQKKN
ncbi:uncharacterized protein LOC110876724 [Helianthus annuus]|uniref:uncharacterized protein LOC110876724 n=1 Tax=Helianthus annuus TaxID=4232 RepID=UPI000B8EED5E|nr:uncharacterized protein LOC110876724 [Helianthus annuus]